MVKYFFPDVCFLSASDAVHLASEVMIRLITICCIVVTNAYLHTTLITSKNCNSNYFFANSLFHDVDFNKASSGCNIWHWSLL